MKSRCRPIAALSIGLVCVGFFFAVPSSLARQKNEREKYDYRPIDRANWTRVDALIKSGKTDEVFKIQTPESSQAAQDEWKLNIGRALIATGNSIHAQYLLTGVAVRSVGTRQGFEALRMVSEIARTQPVDETYLEELAFDLDTKVDEPESRSLVAYFRARALLRRMYPEWSQAALGELQTQTAWSEELHFDRTLQILSSGDSANAYASFEALAKSDIARKQTIRLSKLALARLVFERRDYKAAVATYLAVDLPTRERARSLNELAWSYYYDRAYGKALGTIRVLKSPYFRPLLSPETMLLEMLIYRELCHHKTVKAMASEFLAEFQPIFSAIENRRSLEKLPQFLQMALQEGTLQKRALAIQQVRSERRALDLHSTASLWSNDDALIELIKFGEKRERIIDFEITRLLRGRQDALANWFVDLREQVWFLEYEASMRMIQMNDDQIETYAPPQASRARPTTIFWPVSDEAWLDELLDYEILVHDTCKSSPLRQIQPRPSRGGG